MSRRKCGICNNMLDDGSQTCIVKEKGLVSLAEASRKRNDGKMAHFKSCKSLEVHDKCRKQYPNDKCIAAFLKRGQDEINKTQLRSDVPSFNFKTHCFLCGLIFPANYEEMLRKTRPSKRDPIYSVRKLNMKEKVLDLLKNNLTDHARSIRERIEPVHDLVAADGQYHMSCMKTLYHKVTDDAQRGRPKNEVDDSLDEIFNFLETNDEECQFTLDELVKKISADYKPHNKTVISRLREKYGNDIIISSKQPYVVCFRSTGYKILTDAWYREKYTTEDEERQRIVRTAAAIIVEDIRSQMYDTTHYPPPDKFFEQADDIPETLRVLTDSIVLAKKRGDSKKWKRKSTAIAHSLISAVRPKSFMSPLQVGLGAFLYKKYGSRKLIDVLSSMGFCSTYKEVTRFEISSVMRPPLEVCKRAFSQTVYDNADFNVQTLDGRNTFHAMGGILCLTPKSAVVPDQRILRVTNILSTDDVAVKGEVHLRQFERVNSEGLRAFKIAELARAHEQNDNILPNAPHLIWLYSKYKEFPGTCGWNGFMERVTKQMSYQMTYIEAQPFINAPPSDYDTIYTALLYSAKKTASLGQKTSFVTFDQPLYFKAREILSCRMGDPELSNTIIRLGGFHLLMSFMGSVGYIMDGSGLDELFHTAYAVNSTQKIMTGHAYSRAVRAHIMANTALAKTIMKRMSIPPFVHGKIEELLNSGNLPELLNARGTLWVQEFQEEFHREMQRVAQISPTAKLWIQYFEMTTLIMQFIEAERIGNWHSHLRTIECMLPYFHASGHFLYAKCAHMYLQDMYALQQHMPTEEFDAFTTLGGFTIRRSDKLWCGTWTDMCIEQNLMKHMKSDGGLTRGRGVSDGILSRWTHGMTSLQQVCEVIEQFCEVSFTTSEQHVDSRDARVLRDSQDVHKMTDWFQQHPPFPDSAGLMSISKGIIANDKINCHLSKENGLERMKSIIGKDFKTVKFKRNDRVLPLSAMNRAILIKDMPVPINETTLFQRISVAKQSDEELQEYLSYELCPYPLALFENGGMRKGTKSSLYQAFHSLTDAKLDSKCMYVIDGGYLLHRVLWVSGYPFSRICDSYVDYVKFKYNTNVVVVFDGYPYDHKGTKYMERLRRSSMKNSVEIKFNESMIPAVTQENFLSNFKNKRRLISMLRSKFAKANIHTKQAPEDADKLIVDTAKSLAQHHHTVAVVGNDIDLLVIMVGTTVPDNLYFLKPSVGKTSSALYHPTTATDNKDAADHMLFLHAVSGCDSTSALYGKGKLKCIQAIAKNPDLRTYMEKFKDPNANSEMLFEAGEKFLVALYGGSHHSIGINNLRYKHYLTSAFKLNSNLASIPPSAAAVKQHMLRVYHQVQQWLGQQLDPEQWGWKATENGLIPITTLQPPAPNKLLKQISCKCKKDCTGSCGCRRSGLFCSLICLTCEGRCSNTDPLDFNEEQELDEEEDLDLVPRQI